MVTEVIRGRPSLSIAFLNSKGEEFWLTGVYGGKEFVLG